MDFLGLKRCGGYETMPTRALVTSYASDLRLFPDRWHKVGILCVAAVVLSFPFLANSYWLTIGNETLVTIVGAIAMMVLTGYCGQISLGHAAFIALGGYTAAILAESYHAPFWLVIPAAGFVASSVGLLVGPFALRLEGLYLAIVTLGLLYLVRHGLMSLPELTGGSSGKMVAIHHGWTDEAGGFWDPLVLGPVEFVFEQKLYFLFLLITVIVGFMGKNIQRSNIGRAMMAVRDHDLAAAVLGVNPAMTKVIAFGVSSFIAGVAGAMYGFQQQYLTVDETCSFHLSVVYVAIIVFGGLGTTFGAVAGTIGFKVIEPLAHLAGPHIPLVSTLPQGQQATLVFALLVCVTLVVEPLGILGVWLRIKRYFLAWPFRY
jgi:branched-chain amino acid transport system permease protein